MEKLANNLLKESLYLTGIILISFSAIILASTVFTEPKDTMAIFFFNYFLSIVYLFYLFISNFSKYGWRLSKGKLKHTVLLLVLYFISAFSLNLEMNVFDSAAPWLTVWLIISSVVLIGAANFDLLSKKVSFILFFFLGMALIIFVYYAIYLVPLYLLSFMALVALGISIHSYIPLFMAIFTVIIIVRAVRANRQLLYPVVAGLVVPIIAATFFLVSWYNTTTKIDSMINENTLNDSKLPTWITVSQQLEPSFVNERFLKAGLVYTEANTDNNIFWSELQNSSFDEKKQHDPLVVMATRFFKKSNLDEKARVNILKSLYHKRHQAQERLWAGDHLETVGIVTNIKVFPAYRMAYTEKTITIRNDAKFDWNNQEALYTFRLTEGAVISSLSLWIDGKEQQSRLTTKAKADSAYKTIVGVEQRDPSVVHWQEGNTISLRVFPCTPKENRIFKIGVSSPLRKVGRKLIYRQFSFEGPSAENVVESIQVSYVGAITGLTFPSAFKKVASATYRAEDIDEQEWQFSCDAPFLATEAFSFNNSSYQISDYEKRYETFTPEKIYLDLNGTWSQAEFDAVWSKTKNKDVYVFDQKLVKLSALNKDEMFDRLNLQCFSLFPIQEISQPQKALLISKNKENSPNLNDLDNSDFATALSGYLKAPKVIKVFHLGPLQSPYLKALKEFRVLLCDEGNTSDLAKLLDKNQFLVNQENEQAVVLDAAALIIEKTGSATTKSAPDHLLRLFAYNDLMKKIGPLYFNKNYVTPELIAEAEQAYIVSPISSLIVLETQKDYERFNIDANKNSIKNADMKSAGAVPEPHEWVLFALCICIAAIMLFEKKNRQATC